MLALEDLGENITVLLLSLCDIDTVLLMSRREAAEHKTIYVIHLVDWRLQRYVLIWHPRHIPLDLYACLAHTAYFEFPHLFVQVPTIELLPDDIFFAMTFDEISVYAVVDSVSRWRPIASMNFEDFQQALSPAFSFSSLYIFHGPRGVHVFCLEFDASGKPPLDSLFLTPHFPQTLLIQP
ncbi:hypothetical protein K438DRAFT_1971901 [Mycena galopus ATCC 62051]|nr:hypothetical protein K438DRAFT_1971901 [Mycena galopus ATCC 62051]